MEGEPPPGREPGTTDRILTLPNLLSFARIALTPVFARLIADRETTLAGLLLFAAVAATDWVDGWIARATGQVSGLGKLLDPVADRFAIAGGLVALVVRDAVPMWAAIPILLRDALVLVAGLALLAARRASIQVRYVGKVATFSLMTAVVCIAWGNLGYAFARAFLVMGWSLYAVGIVAYYVATIFYVGDLRRMWANEPRG